MIYIETEREGLYGVSGLDYYVKQKGPRNYKEIEGYILCGFILGSEESIYIHAFDTKEECKDVLSYCKKMVKINVLSKRDTYISLDEIQKVLNKAKESEK